jgi:hypothetical protein
MPSEQWARVLVRLASALCPPLVRGRDVAAFAVRETVRELLAGADAGEDAEDATEAMGDPEAGGQRDDGDHREAVREVQEVGEPAPGIPSRPVPGEAMAGIAPATARYLAMLVATVQTTSARRAGKNA